MNSNSFIVNETPLTSKTDKIDPFICQTFGPRKISLINEDSREVSSSTGRKPYVLITIPTTTLVISVTVGLVKVLFHRQYVYFSLCLKRDSQFHLRKTQSLTGPLLLILNKITQ